MSEFKEGVETVNGVELRYRIDGIEGAPKLVFSNSLGTNLHMWDGQVEAFAGSYHILRYDKRGHGKSGPASNPFEMKTLADDLVALSDALGFQGAHYCGLSIGGMTGQALGIYHSGYFKSLALCATSSQIPEEQIPFWHQRIATVKAEGMEPMVAPVLERWFGAEYRSGNAETLSMVSEMLRTTSPEGYYRCSEAILGMKYTEEVHKITTPSILIPGETDPALPVFMSEIIAERLPGVKMEICQNAAHLCNLEQPEVFNDILGRWLTSQS